MFIRHTPRTWNVVAIVGNGFDLQVAGDFKTRWTTDYKRFYYYLKSIGFSESNSIVERMSEQKRIQEDKPGVSEYNWSDIESAISQAVKANPGKSDEIYQDVRNIQTEFAQFLDIAVSNSLSAQLGDESMNNGWAARSLSHFMYDVETYCEDEELRFTPESYDTLSFSFINMNYTTLLDNYIYLDQNQFDPRPFNSSSNNFSVGANPNDPIIPPSNGTAFDYSDFSSDRHLISINTSLHHPHGQVGIPRSLLFGIDSADPIHTRNDSKRMLKKPYWAQNSTKYKGLMEEADLFILFGCSLGESDGWWWRAIRDRLAKEEDSDLLIYKRCSSDSDKVKEDTTELFLKAADGLEFAEDLEEQIHVVTYPEGGDRIWLSTSRITEGI